MSGLIVRVFAMFAALVFSIGVSMATDLPVLSSSQSGVTIKVTPKTLQGAVWAFDIVFDTHSQELKDDLLKSAVLVVANGVRLVPIEWKGDPPGGHHRKGELRFNAVMPPPTSFELLITRPGESTPRSFRWQQK